LTDARPTVFKLEGKQRLGRGFSRDELAKAGLSLKDALRFGIAVDARRKTVHDENVETVKALLQRQKKATSKSKKLGGKSKS
jgi:large subunit ribosomal protein L13e